MKKGGYPSLVAPFLFVGVNPTTTYTVKKLDADYFDET